MNRQKRLKNCQPSSSNQQQLEGRSVVDVWQARRLKAFKQGGLLVGSFFAGENLFRRALNATILPGLQRIVRALVPNFLRVFLGPMVSARVGLVLFASLSRLACFFVFRQYSLGFVGHCHQGFLASPPGVSISVGFLEKNIKVFSCTLLLGGLSIHFKPLFQNNNKVVSALWVSFFSISIFLVLNDYKSIPYSKPTLYSATGTTSIGSNFDCFWVKCLNTVCTISFNGESILCCFIICFRYLAKGSFFQIVSFWIDRGSRQNS